MLKFNLQGMLIQSTDTDLLRVCKLTAVVEGGVFYVIELIGIAGSRLGRQDPPPGVDKIFRLHRAAVAVAGLFPEMKGISAAIGGHLPVFRNSRNNLPAGGEAG